MKTKHQILLLLVISFFAFFVHNGIQPSDIMEARNLTTAREVLTSDNWVLPTMNGELRLEKPPLPTWISAITMNVSMYNYTVLRFPAAIIGTLLVLFMFFLVKEMSSDKWFPFFAASTVATSFYVFYMGRTQTWDIYSICFMLGAVWMLFRSWGKENSSWIETIVAGILMGLSFLSKGPVAFYAVLLPFLIAYIATYGFQPIRNRWRELLAALFVCLAISSWWYLYIYLSHPELASFVAKKESGAWIGHNVKPWYHYWSFPVQSGIWTIAIVAALIFPYASSKIKTVANYKFIALWVWTSVILLSLMPEKKERYLLPVLLPTGILAAAYFKYLIQAFSENKASLGDKLFLNFNTVLLGTIAALVPVGLCVLSYKGISIPVWQIGIYGGVFLIVGVSFFYSLKKKNVFAIWALMVGFMGLFNLCLLPLTKNAVISNHDYKSIAQIRDDQRLKGIPFYYNGDTVRMEVVWEAGRVIRENNFKKNLQPLQQLPIVMVSNQKVEEFLPDTILTHLDCKVIGRFDNNLGKKKKFSYFLNYVTIIKEKRDHL